MQNYLDDKQLLAFILEPYPIKISKLPEEMLSTDTCSTTQSFHYLYNNKLGVYKGYCWNLMQDVQTGGVYKGISD